MGHRQKSKSKKRPRSWHRGHIEALRSMRVLERFPDTGLSVPPSGAPIPLRRKGRRNRGDAI